MVIVLVSASIVQAIPAYSGDAPTTWSNCSRRGSSESVGNMVTWLGRLVVTTPVKSLIYNCHV